MPQTALPPRIRFDRRELSGSIGDLGTDLPLLAGMILASGVDGGWVFLLFGLMQIVTALIYGIPMPLQPLKVVAVTVIAQGLDGSIIAGGAMAIALIMLTLTLTGAIDGLSRLIPKAVVRGIQIGLGIKLARLALGNYIPSEGSSGLLLGGLSLLFLLIFLRSHRVPAAFIVLISGAFYAVARGAELGTIGNVNVSAPLPAIPAASDIWAGLILLALPQIPLSIGNSMLATQQLADDWFPERRVSLRKIGISYSLFNLFAALFGGMPVCHGSGGMAGHYAFGGRTGGSVVIYGMFFMTLGLASTFGLKNIVALFPLPVLGVILLIEGTTLMGRVRDMLAVRFDWMLAMGVGLTAAFVPNGFMIGMIAGSIIAALRLGTLKRFNPLKES